MGPPKVRIGQKPSKIGRYNLMNTPQIIAGRFLGISEALQRKRPGQRGQKPSKIGRYNLMNTPQIIAGRFLGFV